MCWQLRSCNILYAFFSLTLIEKCWISYIRRGLYTGYKYFSSNNNSLFCAAHTHNSNHFYWDYCSLCHSMSVEKACSACVWFFVCPLHSPIHTQSEREWESQRQWHAYTQLMANDCACVFSNYSFVSADFVEKKKKTLLSRLFCSYMPNVGTRYICVHGAVRTHTRAHVRQTVIDKTTFEQIFWKLIKVHCFH